MKLERMNLKPIYKSSFIDENYKVYQKDQFLKSKELLKEVITDYPISTFETLTLLRENYNGNLIKAIKEIPYEEYTKTRFNCFYQSKLMLKKLEEIGFTPYLLSYKADKLTTPHMDKVVAEGHMSVVVPVIISGEKKVIVYDPGLKIDEPMVLDGENKQFINISGENNILMSYNNNESLYPVTMHINGINKYSYNKKPHTIIQKFNPKFYTENIDDTLFENVYNYLPGYKVTTFSLDDYKRAFISLDHIRGILVFYDGKTNISKTFNYLDIIKLGRTGLEIELSKICSKLGIDVKEIIDNILFMIDVDKEFKEFVLDKSFFENENISLKKVRK